MQFSQSFFLLMVFRLRLYYEFIGLVTTLATLADSSSRVMSIGRNPALLTGLSISSFRNFSTCFLSKARFDLLTFSFDVWVMIKVLYRKNGFVSHARRVGRETLRYSAAAFLVVKLYAAPSEVSRIIIMSYV